MRWLRTVALLVFTVGSGLGAQSPQGRISGQVTSGESGRPLEGARVMVDGTRLGTATRGDGRYLITGVPAGTHRVRVTMLGYAPRLSEPYALADGSTISADFRLVQQAGPRSGSPGGRHCGAGRSLPTRAAPSTFTTRYTPTPARCLPHSCSLIRRSQRRCLRRLRR